MSVPMITYLTFFFNNPSIILIDLNFLIETQGFSIVLLGVVLFIYSFIFRLTHRRQLIQTGPYKFMRHPQYLAFIIITLGLTVISFDTSPIFTFNLGSLSPYTVIFYIWIGEVLAYTILGRIEDFALKAKYGDQFLEYAINVPFMIPFIKINREIVKKNIQTTPQNQ
jgi:protein-S-isoprenylcysteine O-methyltransferase Ste14